MLSEVKMSRRSCTAFCAILILAAAVAGSFAGRPIAAAERSETSAEPVPLWFMFFVQGENRTPLEKDEAGRMQAAHIGNLTRLWNEKKAVAAGPFGERGPLRGVVILTVKERKDVEAEFREDPFVKAGYLKTEMHRWMAPLSAFGKPDQPEGLGKFQLVILKKGANWAAATAATKSPEQLAHTAYLQSLQAQGLAVAGPLLEAGELQGLAIFTGDDAEKITSLMAKDPHVAAGRLAAERKLLYMAKGVVKSPAPGAAP
jgi:uncharacterized protein YciI